jgi:RND family efflux transporter MFP subunit
MSGRQNRSTERRPGSGLSAGTGLLVAVALLLTGGCGGREATTPASDAVTVEAELAAAVRIEVPSTVDIFGTVEADKTASVSTRIMAMVTAVRAQTGDAVGAGQALLEIDPQAARGQLSQAEGALAQARAGLALAERNYQRFEALAESDAASELELDMARMQYEQASGAVAQAEGGVAAASSVAGDSRVVAPFAGRVVRRMVEVGDLATPGRPLMTIESQGTGRLALAIPEGVMAQAGLDIGDSLAVTLDSRSDLGAVEAVIVEMSPGADPASHSFQVKAALPLDGIPSGASGRARVEIGRRTVVAVPQAAVLRKGGLSLVVVRDSEGRAASRVVTLGERLAGDRIEVLSGLAGDETLALGLTSAPPAGARLTGLERLEGPAT